MPIKPQMSHATLTGCTAFFDIENPHGDGLITGAHGYDIALTTMQHGLSQRRVSGDAAAQDIRFIVGHDLDDELPFRAWTCSACFFTGVK